MTASAPYAKRRTKRERNSSLVSRDINDCNGTLSAKTYVQTGCESAGFPGDGEGHLAFLGRTPDLPETAREECGRPALVVSRRADYGQQPDGRAPRVGPNVEGHVPALS